MGYPLTRLDLVLDVVIALAVVAGIRALGTVLVVALIVTPAATARLLCRRIGSMMVVAAADRRARRLGRPDRRLDASVDHDVRLAPGATIVVVLTGLFVLVAAGTAPSAGVGAPPTVHGAERINVTVRSVGERDGRMSNLVDSFGSPLFRRALLEAVLVGAARRRRRRARHPAPPAVLRHGDVARHVPRRRHRLDRSASACSSAARRSASSSSPPCWCSAPSGRSTTPRSIAVVLAGSFALGMLILSTRARRRPGSVGAPRRLGAHRHPRRRADDDRRRHRRARRRSAALHKELVFGAFDRSGAAAVGYPTAVLDAVLLVAVTRRRSSPRSRRSARCWPSPCSRCRRSPLGCGPIGSG